MALEGEHGIVAAHAVVVVGDADELASACLNFDADAGRARVERVFEQLFDYRRGTVDDLSSRNLVCDLVGEYADTAH